VTVQPGGFEQEQNKFSADTRFAQLSPFGQSANNDPSVAVKRSNLVNS